MKYALLLTGCLLLSLNAVADTDDDDDVAPAKPPKEAVTANTKQTAGIVTQVTTQSQYQSEFIAYGKALSSEALLALQGRYAIALSEQQGVAATVAQLEQNKQRQQALYTQGVSSKRLLQEQDAQWQSHNALLTTKQLQAQAIVNEARLLWGKTLTEWLINKPNKSLQALLTGEQTLLQITLPSNKTLTAKQAIMVASSGNRSLAQRAELISAAPQNSTGSQGLSYFLQTRSSHIKAGMAITAWLSESNISQTGVNIPKSALIWSMDSAMVYIKTTNKQFERRVINHYIATADGYFVQDDLKGGEDIVITGAQQLLSEELRRQIPDEDD